jgi:hypothetical protein
MEGVNIVLPLANNEGKKEEKRDGQEKESNEECMTSIEKGKKGSEIGKE